jgi:glutamyl/glutaminyl-tRNA synthetase
VILAPETGEKLSKRDRDRKIRQRSHEWLRSKKKAPADLAAAAQLHLERLIEWLGKDTVQLDLSEQPKVMAVIGLKEADLPEIMVHDFRKTGYLPEVLNNFLALLGWSPGNDLERMSMEELISRFTLEGIGKSNAKFNREKLIAFNTEACASASPERLLAAFQDFLAANPQSPLNQASTEQLARLLQMKAGFRTLREVEEKSRFLFIADDQIEYEPDAMEKVLKKNAGQGADALRGVRDILAGIEQWSAAAIESALNAFCASKGLVLGKVAQPIRVGISGSTISPPIFQSLEFLGKPSTLLRIDRCLKLLDPAEPRPSGRG